MGLCSRLGMSEKYREQISAAFEADPYITGERLGKMLGCGATTAARYAKRYGFRFKPWSERTHSPETREKLSLDRVGLHKGDQNPNFGVKSRPWLEGENSPLRKWHREHPRDQRGENNPVHKVRHLYDDPNYVERITRGLTAHAARKRGATYEEVYGEAKAQEIREKLRQASPGRMAKFVRKETSPERVVREILEGLGVSFQAQAPVGPYTVDFLIPSSALVIQADGDYWHANPALYGVGEGLLPLSKLQTNRRRLDASCDSYAAKVGYRVLRLWERHLNENRDRCVQAIKTALGVP